MAITTERLHVLHSQVTGLTTGDDHTQYQEADEKDAAGGYAGLDGSGDIAVAAVPSGVSHATLADLTTGDPHTQYQEEDEKNAASGYAGLDGSSKLTGTQQVYGTSANTACEGNDSRIASALSGGIAYQVSDATLTDNNPATVALDLLTGSLAVGFYALRVVCKWRGGTASTDGFRSDFVVDGTLVVANVLRHHLCINHGSSTIATGGSATSTDITTDIALAGAADTDFTSYIDMFFQVTTGGVLTFRGAKNTDVAADTVFRENSFMQWTKL